MMFMYCKLQDSFGREAKRATQFVFKRLVEFMRYDVHPKLAQKMKPVRIIDRITRKNIKTLQILQFSFRDKREGSSSNIYIYIYISG